jgi:hypothetical protein
VFGPSVRVVLGLCTDLARTQLGRGWLVKQNIHQNSVQVQSEHSPWTVHGLHGVRTESARIRWGSVKTSMKAFPSTPFMTTLWSWGREGVWVGIMIVGLGSAMLAASMLSSLLEVGAGVGGLKKT